MELHVLNVYIFHFFSMCVCRVCFPFYFLVSFQCQIMNLSVLFSFIVGLTKLQSLNLSFTSVTDSGLKKLCGLTSLKSLNLDARQITDAGLASITSKHFRTFSYHCFDVNICFYAICFVE